MKEFSRSRAVRLTVALALCTAVRGALADDVISYTGGTYTQDFNSLWTNSTTPPQNLEPNLTPVTINQLVSPSTPGVYTPVDLTGSSADFAMTIQTISTMTGWYAINNGGNSSPLTYDVDDGSSTSAALMAYYNPADPINLAGTSNNMALGAAAASGSGDIFFGMELVNNGTASLNAISISYTGQLFHEDTSLKTLTFGYLLDNTSTNATIPISGMTPVGALNVSFTANSFTGSVATANITENLSVMNLPLAGAWAPGETLWVTWDMGRGGSGQGIGIDNLSFSAASVAGAPTLLWNIGSGAWDTVSPNWTGAATIFSNGGTYNVQFGNTATDSLITVDGGGVTPAASVTISNTAGGTYTFTGGSINGAAVSLVVNSGKVVLQAANGYGLATNLNGGTLVVDSNNELGAATAGLNFNGGTLQLAGPLAAGSRAMTVSGAGATMDTQGNTASFGAASSSVPVIHGVLHVSGGGNVNLGIQPTFGSNAAPAGSLLIDAGSTVTLVGNSRGSPTDMYNGGVINGVLSLNNTPVGARFNFDAPGLVDGNDHNGSVAFTGTGEIQVVNGSGWVDLNATNGKTTHAWIYDTRGAVISNASGTFVAEIDVPIVLNPLSVADPVDHPFTPLNVATANFIGAANPDPTYAFGTVIGGTKIGSQGHGPNYSNIKIAGVISGNSDINLGNDYKSGGSGDVTFLAHNTYTGTTLLNGGGALYTGVPDALPPTTNIVFGAFSGAGAAQIDLSGNDQHVQSIEVGLGANSPQSNIIDNSGTQLATLYVTGNVTPFYPYNAQLNDGGTTTLGAVGTAPLALHKSGAGTLVLGEYLALGHTTTSDYSGGTTVSGGVLQIAFDGALGTATGSLTLDGGQVDVENPYLLYNGPTGETTSTWTSARPITVTSNGGTIHTPTFTAVDSSSVNYNLVASVVFTGDGGYNWGGPLTLSGDSGSNVTINGGAGAVSVSNGASMVVGPNVSLSAGGGGRTADPFTDSLDGSRHVAIVANGSFSVASGSVAIAGLTGTGSATVADGATMVSDGIRVSSLTVNGGATLRQGDGNAGTSVLGSIPNITGTLDITDNALVVQSTGATGNKAAVISALETLVNQGKNGGNWSGMGITSSTVANDVATATTHTYHTTLAIADNGSLVTPYTSFGGQPVNAGSVLVTRALAGDGDLNGTVDNADLVVLLTHFGLNHQTQTGGDYDGNGTVDNADLVALLTDYGQSLPASTGLLSVVPAAAGGSGSSAPVPEPASIAILAVGGAALLARRRKGGRRE